MAGDTFSGDLFEQSRLLKPPKLSTPFNGLEALNSTHPRDPES